MITDNEVKLILLAKKEIKEEEDRLKDELKELAVKKGEKNKLLRIFLNDNVIENDLAFNMIVDPKSLGLSDFEVSFGVTAYINNYSIWITKKDDEESPPSEISYVLDKEYSLEKIKHDFYGVKRLLEAKKFLSKPLENLSISIKGQSNTYYIEVFYNEGKIKAVFHRVKPVEGNLECELKFSSFDDLAEHLKKHIY